MTSLVVSDKESPEIYNWCEEFLTSQKFSSSFRKLESLLKPEDSINATFGHVYDKKMQREFCFSPGVGTHFFTYALSFILLNFY